MSGKLFLCGTPIGNLEDITYRVLTTLKKCDVVYAEDTRHSIRLMTHFEISKPLHSYHEHNQAQAGLEIVGKLKNGQNIALISDAGMPGISDPGEVLVKLCIEHELPFEVVPGVTAFTTALVGSGLDTTRFVFEGFLSRDKKQKRKLIEQLKSERRTLIFYESPHRLKDTLKQLYEGMGDRKIVLARELTKRYEEYKRGYISELIAYYSENEIRGEIVLVLEGNSEPIEEKLNYSEEESIKNHVLRLMDDGLEKKEAMKQVAMLRKMKKSDVYSEML